jgi:hypothetical protein
MWVTVGFNDENELHTLPIEDIRMHEISTECWCNPFFDKKLEIVIHNSADGREDFEDGTRKPS